MFYLHFHISLQNSRTIPKKKNKKKHIKNDNLSYFDRNPFKILVIFKWDIRRAVWYKALILAHTTLLGISCRGSFALLRTMKFSHKVWNS